MRFCPIIGQLAIPAALTTALIIALEEGGMSSDCLGVAGYALCMLGLVWAAYWGYCHMDDSGKETGK